MSGEEIRWRFDVQQGTSTTWVPYERELWWYPDEPRWLNCLGIQDTPECWEDPLDLATRELDESLATLAGQGRAIGIRAARIVVWVEPDFDAEPSIVITATPEQMAVGRLRYQVAAVRRALDEVERARTLLRNQILENARVDFLGRNTIARETEGALARRLVLQLLAGRDLVESARRALPKGWSHSCPSPELDWYEPGMEHLGPYWCGPAALSLDVAGEVHLALIDTEGEEPNIMDDDDYDEDDVAAYHRAAALRALADAAKVLPALTAAGLYVTASAGHEATVDDLAATYRGGRVQIRAKRPSIAERPEVTDQPDHQSPTLQAAN